jgi:hypothetical protein
MKQHATFPLTLSTGIANKQSLKVTQGEPLLTPYLKAILSGAAHLVAKTKQSTKNHDLDAATRYIRESATLKK